MSKYLKAERYEDWWDLELNKSKLSQCKVYGSSLDSFELIKKNGTYLEIGTWDGQYSEKMLKFLQPKQLYILDIFFDRSIIDGKPHLEYIKDKFKNHAEVEIIIGDALELEHNDLFNNIRFDYIYLDADNTYDNFKVQLYNALNILKDDGILGINDYTRNNYVEGSEHSTEVFNVIEVVNEFLNANKDWHMVGVVLHISGYNDVFLQRKKD